ncbi:MAG: SUMF1/EgtB/PvdO family nonheme iron enzyme [Candidatus Hydrogenedentes bacterium]|nr:SUMF1/EgtB/PvdO family nonheme iron enzyme [Candidatus Hydrogenedentota bacterium]
MLLLISTVCQSGEAGHFLPEVFSADECSSWTVPDATGLRISEHFIAGPKPDEVWSEWYEKALAYREAIRSGPGKRTIRIEYDGVRAWVRMNETPARAYALAPGDRVAVQVEARWLEGNATLCLALDRRDRANGAWTGWTGVLETLDIPRDGAWHSASAALTVPEFDERSEWVLPIIGMDATHDSTRGSVELRELRCVLEDPVRMASVAASMPAKAAGLDRRLYDRADLTWAAKAFTCHFTFMYDRAFYNPEEERYTIDALLDDGEREFGGYDALVLWQGYPRLGVDPRNQFDMYRDMPGGLGGLRDVVRRVHARGARVFVDYNPWDTGTRRPSASDAEAVAELLAALEADGVFLDTMSAAGSELRACVDAARPGVVFAPEGHPAIDQLSACNASWAQWLNDPEPPGILHLKWIEPRHMQHQIRRWDVSHAQEVATAFFNGSGMLVWENVFGTYNPWPETDRDQWRRASTILHAFPDHFTGDAWQPFYPTLTPGLFANCWPGESLTLFTLKNTGEALHEAPLLDLPSAMGTTAVDLWNNTELAMLPVDGGLRVLGSLDDIGCFAILRDDTPQTLVALLRSLRTRLEEDPSSPERNVVRPVLNPVAVAKTATAATPPEGMVSIPATSFTMRITHQRRECGCYPDPGTAAAQWKDNLWGSPFDGTITHTIGPVEVKPFFMDTMEVSNVQFKRFLDATGYAPKHPENFLEHWPNGVMPRESADYPVVYVDLDDARAYARWAGKRLPTEIEWQLAAQGMDGRSWPWGVEFDAAKCNGSGQTQAVDSLPEGRSPFGCYHMAGNVWEWTESERDDGHTRFVMIRGGSYFNAKTSGWYVPGGPQPCDSHAKFLRMWPGLDRCATVGFRCVKDAD